MTNFKKRQNIIFTIFIELEFPNENMIRVMLRNYEYKGVSLRI